MLAKAQTLSNRLLCSNIASHSLLRPRLGRQGRQLVATLMLTSLVDAFSILVIFLILNHSAAQDTLVVPNQIQLPTAKESQTLMRGAVIKVVSQNYFLDDLSIRVDQLGEELIKKKSQGLSSDEGIVVVADRELEYTAINPILLAANQAGISKIKFVVKQSR